LTQYWEASGVVGRSMPRFAWGYPERTAVCEALRVSKEKTQYPLLSQFSYPAAGSIGSSGRNAFRGPRYFNIDASLVKRFRISEYHALVFRAEAYNAFNNVNFTNPAVTLTNSNTFGKISGARAARIMQMALRYDF
jgi:hypothetical protein